MFLYGALNELHWLEDLRNRESRKRQVLRIAAIGEFRSIFPLAAIHAVTRSYFLVKALLGLQNFKASAFFFGVDWSVPMSSPYTA